MYYIKIPPFFRPITESLNWKRTDPHFSVRTWSPHRPRRSVNHPGCFRPRICPIIHLHHILQDDISSHHSGCSARSYPVARPTVSLWTRQLHQGDTCFGKRWFFWSHYTGLKFLDPLLVTHASTRLQDIAVVRGERVDFTSGEELVSYLKGLFCKEKGMLDFWEITLASALQKTRKNVPERESFFSRKQAVKMIPSATLSKSVRNCQYLSSNMTLSKCGVVP